MFLLFDIGGTHTRFTTSQDGKEIGEVTLISTFKNFEEGILRLEKFADEETKGEKIIAAAGGIAGSLDHEKTMLVGSPHIPGWTGKPLKKALEDIMNAPVFLENDAALAGLGEAVFGAGQKFQIMVYITISTGIGGARIVDKKIDKNALGFEPGQQVIDYKNEASIESIISGSALERRFNKKAYEITDEAIWEEEARILAYGLHNGIMHWSPEGIVLGGSMILKKPGIDIERVRFHLKKILKNFLELPQVTEASLGDYGGLYGALTYVQQQK